MSILFIFSLVGSLFICSFSSIISALLLIISTLLVILVMYWNLVSLMPLYIFSLFMLGGLYVLIGFVMMADENDLDMVMSELNIKDYLLMFISIFFGLNFSGFLMNSVSSMNFIGFSSAKSNDWTLWGPISSIFIFLVFILFIFLFILHSFMKGSMSSSGFVK